MIGLLFTSIAASSPKYYNYIATIHSFHAKVGSRAQTDLIKARNKTFLPRQLFLRVIHVSRLKQKYASKLIKTAKVMVGKKMKEWWYMVENRDTYDVTMLL
jgi:hypothetical protein